MLLSKKLCLNDPTFAAIAQTEEREEEEGRKKKKGFTEPGDESPDWKQVGGREGGGGCAQKSKEDGTRRRR